jgi:putative membrane protein
MINRQISLFLWGLLAVYTTVTLVLRLAPGVVPFLLGAALLTFLPFVFLFVHGSLNYRFRDMLVFAAITLVVSNIFENLSILTGFPFGHYYYTDSLGPKLFLVPILIGPAYLGTGYLAWTLARLLLGAPDGRPSGQQVWTVPALASFLMVAWDLSFDPITSTIGHSWIWQQGGNYFGVPFSNYLGWFLTVFVFFQLFALYLRGRPKASATAQTSSRGYWLLAVLFYGAIALGTPLNILTQTANATVADAAGVLWRTRDIYVVCGLVCLFTMFPFTIQGLMRLAGQPATVRNLEQSLEFEGQGDTQGLVHELPKFS